MRRRPPERPVRPGRDAQRLPVNNAPCARLGPISPPQRFLQYQGSSPRAFPCVAAMASRGARCLNWRIRKRLSPECRGMAALDLVRAEAVIASARMDRQSQPLPAGMSPFKRTRPERSLQPRSR